MEEKIFTSSASVDQSEIDHFSRMADSWWDPKGKFKPLHDLNPLRLSYIRDQIAAHFGRDASTPTPLAGLSLIDIGTGGGLIAEPMARMGATVTGLDASAQNIATASLHAASMGLTIDYRHDTAEHLAESGQKFDVVLALEIIEHVANVESFMAACTALVKPDGLLIMSTINRTTKAFMLAIVGAEYVMRWLPRGTHQWKKFLKPSELHAALRPHGFSVTSQAGMIYNPVKSSWSLSDSDLDVNYLLAAHRAR